MIFDFHCCICIGSCPLQALLPLALSVFVLALCPCLFGLLACWPSGPFGPLTFSPLAFGSLALLALWAFGPFALLVCPFDSLALWPFGPLAFWPFGPLPLWPFATFLLLQCFWALEVLWPLPLWPSSLAIDACVFSFGVAAWLC